MTTPYELLKMSAPKPTAMPAAYDLYSMMQASEGTPASYEEPPARETDVSGGTLMQTSADTQKKKTHYISDIQQRHKSALSRTSIHPAAPGH